MFSAEKSAQTDWKKIFIIFSVILLLVRLIVLMFSTLNLSVDEAQYWRWSTEFDWGYYSKPPMIAWIIGLSTSIFGHDEWAIRLLAPFLHATTGIFLFLAGRRLWSEKEGFFAAAIYLTMPGVWLSSTIISTDAALLMFWSAGLYALTRLRDQQNLTNAALLGIAIGLGFLSKYAMVYFLIGLALALLFDQTGRRALLSPRGAVTALAAGLILTPHALWSLGNGFKTIGHTADNANWGEDMFNPDEFFTFFFDQFGVFGPVSFALLVTFVILFALSRTQLRSDTRARLLLGFVLPPLLIILVQAFLSRAHANWAATAYPAAAILIGAWSVHGSGRLRAILMAGIGFNLLLGIVYMGALVAPPSVVNEAGLANGFKRVRAWPETIERVNAIATEMGATSIVVDEREIWHGLDYYGRDGVIEIPLRSWQIAGVPQSFSEETPISDSDAVNALVLNFRPSHLDRLRGDFDTFEETGELVIDLGGGKERRFTLFRASGFDPAPRDGIE